MEKDYQRFKNKNARKVSNNCKIVQKEKRPVLETIVGSWYRMLHCCGEVFVSPQDAASNKA